MKQILNDKELSGKTIERTCLINDRHYFLFFTDDTFCVFAGCGWEEHEVMLDEEGFNLTPTQYNVHDLKALGLINEPEYTTLLLQYRNEGKESAERAEIEQLKKLQQKYPDVK